MIGCIECARTFFVDPLKMTIVIASIIISISFLISYKKYSNLPIAKRVVLLYLHLLFLVFPLVFYYFYRGCASLLSNCDALHKISILVFFTFIFSFLIGIIITPIICAMNTKTIKNKFRIKYTISNFINKSRTLTSMNKYKNTEVRIIDSAKPIAYSMTFIKNIVFLSVGLLDILNKKEVESVVLHELSHIKSKSSLLKFSAGILRKLSPFSIVLGFSSDLDKEEKKADKFASEMQGTNKHIRSARNKIEYFYRECNR